MVSNSKMKDVHCLLKTIGSFSGGQATVVDFDSDNVATLAVQIKPDDGVYKGGSFKFEIDLETYPEGNPSVTCKTRIYHPNVDMYEERDNVCLNIFDSVWGSDLSLEDVVQGLLFLFYEPNLDDPLSTMFEPGMDYCEFVDNVRQSLLGEEVDGEEFPQNLDETEITIVLEKLEASKEKKGIVVDLLEELLNKTMDIVETNLSGEVEKEETTPNVEQEKTTIEQDEARREPSVLPLTFEVDDTVEPLSVETTHEDKLQNNDEVFLPTLTRELSKSEQKKGMDEEINIMEILETDLTMCTENGDQTIAALRDIENIRTPNNTWQTKLCESNCYMDNLIPELTMITTFMSNALKGFFNNAWKGS